MKKIKGNSQFTLKQTPKTEKGGEGWGEKDRGEEGRRELGRGKKCY